MVIVEVSEYGRKLSLDRGFLVVGGEEEVGRVPLDEVGGVIITTRACSFTSALVIELTTRRIPFALCGEGFLPTAWLQPIVGVNNQTSVVRAQLRATDSFRDRLWRMIVRAKIAGQASVLEGVGRESGLLRALVSEVEPGDPRNVEATASQRYWPHLFGRDFRRDREASGVNAMLNYGYTIVRSAVARAAVAAGMHPSASIKHLRDPMALADDLMEPFRPAVDRRVFFLTREGEAVITLDVKRALVGVLEEDVGGLSVKKSIEGFVRLVASAYVEGKLPKWGGIDVAGSAIRSSRDNPGAQAGGEWLQECPEGSRL